MASSGLEVTIASKPQKTTTIYQSTPSHFTKSTRGSSNVSTFLVDINRTTPVRVRDLSTVSSVATLMRYVSPLELSFHERSTRHKFVRNVFAVLTLQFSLIMALSLAATFVWVLIVIIVWFKKIILGSRLVIGWGLIGIFCFLHGNNYMVNNSVHCLKVYLVQLCLC